MVSVLISPRAVNFVSVAIGLLIFTIVVKKNFSSHDSNQFDTYYYDSDSVNGPPQVAQSYSSGTGFLASVQGKVSPWLGSSSSLSQHIKTQEAIYNQLLADRKKAYQKYAKMTEASERSFWPQAPGGGGSIWETPWTIWDLTSPAWNCPHTNRRIGRLGDGGKWLCGLERLVSLPKSRKSDQEPRNKQTSPLSSDDEFGTTPDLKPGHQPGCIIYSFGINDESSFEEDLMKQTPNCRIWGYDPTVDDFGPELRKHKSLNRAHFLKAGLSDKTDTKVSPAFYSIHDLMRINGHDHIDVLKIDIEGGEFDSLRSTIQHFMDKGEELPIAQLQIELHVDGRISFDDFIEWWELLEKAGFRPFFTEPNLPALTLGACGSKPCYTEYSLLNIKDKRSPYF